MAEVALNLIVLRCMDLDKSADFYRRLGMRFEKHRHGEGPEHCVAEIAAGVVFELYPASSSGGSTGNTRLGFKVQAVDEAIKALAAAGDAETVVSAPAESEWGRRAVVKDPDGHRVELLETSQSADGRWLLIRQDDHGQRFIMGSFGEEKAARAVLAEYSRKQHKQDYWLEEATG